MRTVVVQDQAISADGLQNFPLGPNPLSALLIALRPLNDTGTLANFQTYRGIAAAMNRITVQYRGMSVVSMPGQDLVALNYFRHGIMPFQGQHDDADDERRCCVVPVLFGRNCFHPRSCFPQSHRGELNLEIDFDIADTGYDGMRLSVEAIELLDAKPTEFERHIAYAETPGATGDFDLDMAVGNDCRGILLFGTTPFAGASPAPSWGRLKVLLDNQEVGFGSTDWEVLQADHCLWGRQPPAYDGHTHRVTVTGCAQTAVETVSGPINIGQGIAGATDINGWNQYAYMDFDPTRDDLYTLKTKGSSLFVVRGNIETADALRAIPTEVMKL
jgi:hypothetical protein